MSNYQSLTRILAILLAFLCLLTSPSQLLCKTTSKFTHQYPHFYAGLSIGYGRTTWGELIAHDSGHDEFTEKFLLLSVPDKSKDYGTTWGGFIGYQFGKSFALEARYVRYPNTKIILSELNFYEIEEFISHTQAFSIISKFILPLINSRVNAFLDAGFGFIHRNDTLAKVTRAGPTFGLGLMANASKNVMIELGFDYHVGYARSTLIPVKDFVPFLFGVYFNVGYRIA